LFHEAWQQRITANKTHIVLSGGKLINNHHELEGSISLSVAQYLSLQTNLWLTHFTAVESLTPPIWPSLPTPPGPSDLAIAEVDTNNKTTIDRIVALKETRSMRSNEIHYIDHSLLGVIVKIQPAP
jgi:hypothetical protein